MAYPHSVPLLCISLYAVEPCYPLKIANASLVISYTEYIRPFMYTVCRYMVESYSAMLTILVEYVCVYVRLYTRLIIKHPQRTLELSEHFITLALGGTQGSHSASSANVPDLKLLLLLLVVLVPSHDLGLIVPAE